MDTMKNMAFMAMGAAGMFVFLMYKKPVNKMIKNALDKESKMVDNMLEDMM